MNKKAAGFTLIELLIVIAIIGILAAVLIPNLLGARVRAFDSAAQSCAKAVATYQETLMIDTNSYTTGTISTVTDSGLNVCTNVAIAAGTGNVSSFYVYTTKHANGKATFTVSPNGITR